jgi:flagellum-specific peptidoglycan hydrolase FlgJ
MFNVTLQKIFSKLIYLFLLGALTISVGQDDATADSVSLGFAQEELVLPAENIENQSIVLSLSKETDPMVMEFMADHIVTLETADWPDGYRGEFLQEIAVASLISGIVNKIPPSVIMGQAIFESGWGRSRLAKKYNNLFGIKGYGTSSIAVNTYEETSNGIPYRHRTSFRTFQSRQDSIAYHGNLLSTDRRYKLARKYRNNWWRFIKVASTKYASSPTYANQVASIVRYYRLDRWDAFAVQGIISGPVSELEVSKNVR